MSGARTDAAPAGGPLSGAIVAGGRSARLGTDKRLVVAGGDGTPLLARTADVLRGLVDDLQVVVAREEDRELAARLVAGATVTLDARPDAGPAAGLEAALTHARHDLVVVLATDHPRLSTDVLGLLVASARSSDAGAVALEGPRGVEPFLAVYRRDVLPQVSALLDAGERRMQAVVAALGVELVSADRWRALDPDGATLADVDVPEDLDRLG